MRTLQAEVTAPVPATGAPLRALTLAEACSALGVSTSTLRRWADAGHIRSVRTAGGHRRFPMAEIRRLNGSRQAGEAPAVRPAPAPQVALPAVAATLRAHGDELLRLTTAVLYRDGRPGWFSAPGARDALAEWMAEVTEGCATGRPAMSARASDRLLVAAGLAGTPTLERDVFLERFFELVVRAVVVARAPREEAVAVRRLARSVRHRNLLLADAR